MRWKMEVSRLVALEALTTREYYLPFFEDSEGSIRHVIKDVFLRPVLR